MVQWIIQPWLWFWWAWLFKRKRFPEPYQRISCKLENAFVISFCFQTEQRNRTFHTAFMECNNKCWNGTCNWFWWKSLYSSKIYSTRQWCPWRSFDVILTLIRIKIQECTIWMFQDVLLQNASELQLLASTSHSCCLFHPFYYLLSDSIKISSIILIFPTSRSQVWILMILNF